MTVTELTTNSMGMAKKYDQTVPDMKANTSMAKKKDLGNSYEAMGLDMRVSSLKTTSTAKAIITGPTARATAAFEKTTKCTERENSNEMMEKFTSDPIKMTKRMVTAF